MFISVVIQKPKIASNEQRSGLHFVCTTLTRDNYYSAHNKRLRECSVTTEYIKAKRVLIIYKINNTSGFRKFQR